LDRLLSGWITEAHIAEPGTIRLRIGRRTHPKTRRNIWMHAETEIHVLQKARRVR
jgi:hypothetical protein